jgi:uncharacterized membrane protein YcgQ (UPF0703/DUF1980 family)
MGKETQSVLVALLGGVLIGITVSGRFTNYVKPGFGPLLLASGIILLLVAAFSLVQVVRADRRRSPGADPVTATGDAAGGAHRNLPTGVAHDHTGDETEVDAHGPSGDEGDDVDAHGHTHDGSRAPWLILVPVMVLLLIAPSALGADAVARRGASQAIAGLDVTSPVAGPAVAAGDKSGAGITGDGGYVPNDGSGQSNNSKQAAAGAAGSSGTGGRGMDFPALPAGTDPQLAMKQLVLRALYDNQQSVSTTPVTVTGFIADAGTGQNGGYTIARVVISCCAADANPMRVHVDGAAPYPANTWVNAVVVAQPGTGTLANDYVPSVTVKSIEQTSQPSDPYEH